MLRRIALSAILAGVSILANSAAYADGDDPVRGDIDGVTISVTVPGKPGGTSGDSSAPRCLKKDGAEVACRGSAGWWHSERECYVKAENPQPEKTDPVWGGRTDGVIAWCLTERDIASNTRGSRFWLPASEPTVDPAIVAQTVVEHMGLSAVKIGMVPWPTEKAGSSVGLVGRAAWMWVDSPDETTWGPVSKSASVSGVSVTATARVEKVVWDMGDGHQVTCAGVGTVWSTSSAQENRGSPDCGYRYEKQGHYAVTATSHWRVDWAGAGRTGVIRMTRVATVHNVIGELHVLTSR